MITAEPCEVKLHMETEIAQVSNSSSYRGWC